MPIPSQPQIGAPRRSRTLKFPVRSRNSVQSAEAKLVGLIGIEPMSPTCKDGANPLSYRPITVVKNVTTK